LNDIFIQSDTMVKTSEGKDVYKLLEKLKTSTVQLEGLASKKQIKTWKNFNFSMTSDNYFYLMDLRVFYFYLNNRTTNTNTSC
jgi:predicted translin family RNA/ssDNA-binding protein